METVKSFVWGEKKGDRAEFVSGQPQASRI